MGRYNLLDEKWITVLLNNGSSQNVSMIELFKNAHNYRRLAGEMETQNFAVMRVLETVLMTVFTRVDAQENPYAALQLDEMIRPKEPVDEDDEEDYLDALDQTWRDLWKAGSFPSTVYKYLEKWRDRFYLLDNKYPFYQVTEQVLQDNLKVKSEKVLSGNNAEGKQMNRLISESGNKTALFSPVAEKSKNKMSEAELTRWLITLQGYYGTLDKVKPKGFENVKYSKGWLYDIGGIYLEGNNLFETLMMNLILHHPEKEQFSLSVQFPCWESTPAEWVDNIMRQKPIDNLSSLYTNWSRAVYIDPTWTDDKDVTLGVVKLAEIPKENFFLEPMTLWKKPKKEEYYIPMTLKPSQSLWRSFGLITITDLSKDMKRPEVIDYLYNIKKNLLDSYISIRSVGMQPDGNATSWLPKDEITDVLQMNEMLIDEGDNGWIVRISDIVNQTKWEIENVYQRYLVDVKEIRGISNSEFTDVEKEKVYAAVDKPFREWLLGIRAEDSKEEKSSLWIKQLNNIILNLARSIQEQFLPRDLILNSKGVNLPMAYSRLQALLKKQEG